MAKTIFIRFSGDGTKQVRWLIKDTDAPVRTGQGELGDAAEAAQGARVTVIVPGSEVLLTRARVPTQQRQRLLRAIPYALEEQLAEDVESLHFAIGDRDEEGNLAVAVTSKNKMEAWRQVLEDGGLKADVMVSETLALPFQSGRWTLLIEPGTALLRTGPQAGYSLPAEDAAGLLSLALKQRQDDAPEQITVLDGGQGLQGQAPLQGELDADVTLKVETVSDVMQPFSRALSGGPVINLLQGDFSRREQVGRLWRPWRPAAAVLVVLLLVEAGMAVHSFLRLRAEERSLAQNIEQVYRQAFPDATRIVNPEAQMKQKLAELKAGGQGGGLVGLLTVAGPVLNKKGSLDVRGLRYREGALELDLELKDLPLLDKVKQELTASGLSVEIQAASTQGDKVESRLEIRGGGA